MCLVENLKGWADYQVRALSGLKGDVPNLAACPMARIRLGPHPAGSHEGAAI